MSLERTDTMTAETVTADDLGAPTAVWLRTRGYSAKKVARVVGKCEGIGKQLLAGRAPTPEQMTALSRHFGWDFVKHVFQAVIGPDQQAGLAALESRLVRLEEWHAAEHKAVVQASTALSRDPSADGPALARGSAPTEERRSGTDRRSA